MYMAVLSFDTLFNYMTFGNGRGPECVESINLCFHHNMQ